jgi:WD40 repeat protein
MSRRKRKADDLTNLAANLGGMMGEDSSVAFSPDGKRIVAGQRDGTARVIDAQTGAVLLELKMRPWW